MAIKLKEAPRRNVISINTDEPCVLCGQAGAAENRFCLDCTGFGASLEIPRPHEFRDEEGREADYLLAPELARIGRLLIKNYETDFDSIRDAEIDYFWKKKGGGAGGKATLGKCKKVTGDLKYYSKKDYLVWVAADNCFSCNFYQLTAIVFHELCHGWYNPANGNFDLVSHDSELFHREYEVFGAWKFDLANLKQSVERAAAVQPALF